MSSASQSKLEQRVIREAGNALGDRHYVTAIDVLMGIGWLSPPLVEDWRRGRITYLERVVGASLHKIATAMRVFRRWAEQSGLSSSKTVYVAWKRDRHALRFSKSGDPTIMQKAGMIPMFAMLLFVSAQESDNTPPLVAP